MDYVISLPEPIALELVEAEVGRWWFRDRATPETVDILIETVSITANVVTLAIAGSSIKDVLSRIITSLAKRAPQRPTSRNGVDLSVKLGDGVDASVDIELRQLADENKITISIESRTA